MSHPEVASTALPHSTQAAPIIQVTGLRKSYDRRKEILKGLDLTITQGERVALVGANGSGKSTFLRATIGLHPISGGEIKTLGQAFTETPSGKQRAHLRRQTGFVFQKHCLVRRRSVLSNVIHGHLGMRGSWRAFTQVLAPQEWREAAMEALDAVSLADFAMARADALSGGQQQRVAIARAIVGGPRLLIADEPAASLDPAAGEEVMALFSNLCAEHAITLLFTSHDMAHAKRYSDRIVALKAGQILFDQPSDNTSAEDLQAVFNAET